MYDEPYDYEEEEGRTGFDYAVEKLLNEEINRRMKEKVWDYESVKEKQRNYQNEQDELNKQIRELQQGIRDGDYKMGKLNKQHQEETQKIKDEFGKSYIESMIGEWKNHTRAYYIKKRNIYRICPHCNRTKKEEIEAHGQVFKVECRFCDGSGTISDLEMSYDYECIKDIVVVYKSDSPYLAINTYSGLKELKGYYQKEDVVKQETEKFNKDRNEKLLNRHSEFKKKNNI